MGWTRREGSMRLRYNLVQGILLEARIGGQCIDTRERAGRDTTKV